MVIRTLSVSGCLLIAAPAVAAPPPGADMSLAPWFHSLHVPVSDRDDNPTGDYVTCIQRDHWTSGVPDGPRVLCLFKPLEPDAVGDTVPISGTALAVRSGAESN